MWILQMCSWFVHIAYVQGSIFTFLGIFFLFSKKETDRLATNINNLWSTHILRGFQMAFSGNFLWVCIMWWPILSFILMTIWWLIKNNANFRENPKPHGNNTFWSRFFQTKSIDRFFNITFKCSSATHCIMLAWISSVQCNKKKCQKIYVKIFQVAEACLVFTDILRSICSKKTYVHYHSTFLRHSSFSSERKKHVEKMHFRCVLFLQTMNLNAIPCAWLDSWHVCECARCEQKEGISISYCFEISTFFNGQRSMMRLPIGSSKLHI